MSSMYRKGSLHAMQMKHSSPLMMRTLGEVMKAQGEKYRNQHLKNLGQSLVSEARVEARKRQLDRLLKQAHQSRP